MTTLRRLAPRSFATGAKILDAGCGSGRDILAFIAGGHEVIAFDASSKMVRLASRRLGFPVIRLSFDQLEFRDTFDGVWACASLLHVPRRRIRNALRRLALALKPGGILYASFRWGDDEAVCDDRLFTDFREETFREVLGELPELRPLTFWRTPDARPGRADIEWLNVLLEKVTD